MRATPAASAAGIAPVGSTAGSRDDHHVRQREDLAPPVPRRQAAKRVGAHAAAAAAAARPRAQFLQRQHGVALAGRRSIRGRRRPVRETRATRARSIARRSAAGRDGPAAMRRIACGHQPQLGEPERARARRRRSAGARSGRDRTCRPAARSGDRVAVTALRVSAREGANERRVDEGPSRQHRRILPGATGRRR